MPIDLVAKVLLEVAARKPTRWRRPSPMPIFVALIAALFVATAIINMAAK